MISKRTPLFRISVGVLLVIFTSLLIWTERVEEIKEKSWAENYIEESEKVREKARAKLDKFIAGMNRTRDGWGLWDYVQATFTCPLITERIGSAGDGGKWICGLKAFEDKDCVIYSFGVNTDSTFEMEMMKRANCMVYAYDPTVTRMNLEASVNKSRVFFTPLGLGGEDNLTQKKFTLGHFMRKNGHKWIDFLKIDVEGWEFPAFKQISEEFGENFPFGHLNLEIHPWGGSEKSVAEKQFSDLMKQIEGGGLRAFKKEENPYCRSCKEFSFINVRNRENKFWQF